jgi:hypothetical protein
VLGLHSAAALPAWAEPNRTTLKPSDCRLSTSPLKPALEPERIVIRPVVWAAVAVVTRVVVPEPVQLPEKVQGVVPVAPVPMFAVANRIDPASMRMFPAPIAVEPMDTCPGPVFSSSNPARSSSRCR